MDRMPEIDLPFTPGHPRRNEPGSAWVQMDLTRLAQLDTYIWSLRAPPGQERLPVILFGSQPLLETMDDKVLEQIGNGAWLPGLVGAAVTMPDAHWGYGFPICYALSVDLESSPSPTIRRVGSTIRPPPKRWSTEPAQRAHGRSRSTTSNAPQRARRCTARSAARAAPSR